jgi:signal transduction histidine kinase
VFVLDPRHRSEDIVPLTRIVASRIASELEQRVLTGELAQSAISQERMRLARDMHDSVLQDLTAASLLLKMISDRMPGKLVEPLKEARWLLANQQRRIRNFVSETSGKPATGCEPLGGNLDSLVSMLRRQWQCKMMARVSPPDLQVGSALSAEIFQLVCEATANAVRHGGATQINVQFARMLDNFRLEISDNGTGMPADKTMEPESIKKRVTALNGKLLLSSSEAGVQLSIDLPGP